MGARRRIPQPTSPARSPAKCSQAPADSRFLKTTVGGLKTIRKLMVSYVAISIHWVLSVGVLMMRALLFGVCIRGLQNSWLASDTAF